MRFKVLLFSLLFTASAYAQTTTTTTLPGQGNGTIINIGEFHSAAIVELLFDGDGNCGADDAYYLIVGRWGQPPVIAYLAYSDICNDSSGAPELYYKINETSDAKYYLYAVWGTNNQSQHTAHFLIKTRNENFDTSAARYDNNPPFQKMDVIQSVKVKNSGVVTLLFNTDVNITDKVLFNSDSTDTRSEADAIKFYTGGTTPFWTIGVRGRGYTGNYPGEFLIYHYDGTTFDNYLKINPNNTTMVLAEAGYLGVGQYPSGAYKFEVSGSSKLAGTTDITGRVNIATSNVPDLMFDGDVNTGIYRNTEDILLFQAGGLDILKLNGSTGAQYAAEITGDAYVSSNLTVNNKLVAPTGSGPSSLGIEFGNSGSGFYTGTGSADIVLEGVSFIRLDNSVPFGGGLGDEIDLLKPVAVSLGIYGSGTDLQLYSNWSQNGLIKFGDNSAYDEANTRLGLNITNPGYTLDVRGTGYFSGQVTIDHKLVANGTGDSSTTILTQTTSGHSIQFYRGISAAYIIATDKDSTNENWVLLSRDDNNGTIQNRFIIQSQGTEVTYKSDGTLQFRRKSTGELQYYDSSGTAVAYLRADATNGGLVIERPLATLNSKENLVWRFRASNGSNATSVGFGEKIQYTLQNGAGASVTAANQYVYLKNVTQGVEDASMLFDIRRAGAMTSFLELDGSQDKIIAYKPLVLASSDPKLKMSNWLSADEIQCSSSTGCSKTTLTLGDRAIAAAQFTQSLGPVYGYVPFVPDTTYDGGSLDVTLFWGNSGSATPTGEAPEWRVYCRFVNSGQELLSSTGYGSALYSNPAICNVSSAYLNCVAHFVGLTCGGSWSSDSIIMLKIERSNGTSDTLTETANVWGLKVKYSRQQP